MPSLTTKTPQPPRPLLRKCMTPALIACVFKSNSPRRHLAAVIAVIEAQGTVAPHLAINASSAIKPVTGPGTAPLDAVAVTVATVRKSKDVASNVMNVAIVHVNAVENPADVADLVAATTPDAATDRAVPVTHTAVIVEAVTVAVTVVMVVVMVAVMNAALPIVATIDAVTAVATLQISAVVAETEVMMIDVAAAHLHSEAARPLAVVIGA